MPHKLKYNWDDIQNFYNQGNSYRDCCKKFGMSQASIWKAKLHGRIKTRNSVDGLKLRYKIYGGKPLSLEHKNKVKQTILNKVQNGTWHYSFSKIRTHKFISKFIGEVKLMGKWELEYAKYLDQNDIEWRRPQEKFYYEFNGLKSGRGYYTPDFYLVEDKLYIEIKGYETDKDRAKWKWFPKDLKHKVLKRKDLIDLGLEISDK